MSNATCPRCGKTNPADIHTCTSKKDIEQWFIDQDQKADSNPIGYLLWDAGLGWWEFVEEEPVEYYDYKAVYAQPKAEPEAEPPYINFQGLTLEEIESCIKSNVTITDPHLRDGVIASILDAEHLLLEKNTNGDEPEAEPVAWTNPEELGALKDEVSCYMYAEPLWGNKDIPLYTRPEPARKPMTKEEIDSKFELDGSMFSSYTAFKQGVRWAEKQHGIGGDDGN